MRIVREKIVDRASWLVKRSRNIGASEAGALLGVHEYLTAYELWARHSGLIPSHVDETPSIRRGRHLEVVAINFLKEEHPGWKIQPGDSYYHEPDQRIGATPDCLAWNAAGFGIIQIKSVESSIFRSKWHNEDGDIEPPLWIAIQAIVEASVVGAEWAAVAPLVIGHGIELPLIPISLDNGVFERVQAAVREHWQRVETSTPPQPDFSADADIIAALNQPVIGESVDLTQEDGLAALCEEDRALAVSMGAGTRRRAEIRAILNHRMKSASEAHVAGGWRVVRRSVTRKPYTVPEGTYTSITIKEAK